MCVRARVRAHDPRLELQAWASHILGGQDPSGHCHVRPPSSMRKKQRDRPLATSSLSGYSSTCHVSTQRGPLHMLHNLVRSVLSAPPHSRDKKVRGPVPSHRPSSPAPVSTPLSTAPHRGVASQQHLPRH